VPSGNLTVKNRPNNGQQKCPAFPKWEVGQAFYGKIFGICATFSEELRLREYPPKLGAPRLYSIYLIYNNITEKYYVGQTRRSLLDRLSDHKKDARRGVDTYLYKAMRFYGENYFSICRLGDGGETQEKANEAERFWVLLLQANDPSKGYNLTSGGGAGRVLSESSRKKIGDACRKPNDPEQECCGCHLVKPLEDYHVNNAVSNGRMSRCKECCLKQASEKYWNGEGLDRANKRAEKQGAQERHCSGCNMTKPLDRFHRSKNYPGGHSYICKECRSQRRKIRTATDLSPCLGTA
jgi:group I intron endonuclease